MVLATTLHVSGRNPTDGNKGTCSWPVPTVLLTDSLVRHVITFPLYPCKWKLTQSARGCHKGDLFAFDAYFDTTCLVYVNVYYSRLGAVHVRGDTVLTGC